MKRRQMQKINFKSKLELDSLTVLCKAQHVIDRNGEGNEKTDFFLIWFSFSVLENAVKKNRNVFISLLNNDVIFFSPSLFFSFLNCHFGFVVKVNIADFLLYDSSLDKNSRK